MRGKPDALAFAAGERAGDARQVEIFEAHIHQEFQAGLDFLEDAGGDFALLGSELGFEIGEPGVGGLNGEVGDLADVELVDLHGQSLRLQAVAIAGAAGLVGMVTGELFAHPGAVGFTPAALDVADHAFEGLFGFVGAQAIIIGDGDFIFAGAIENGILHFLGQVLPWGGHGGLEMLGQRFEGLGVVR